MATGFTHIKKRILLLASLIGLAACDPAQFPDSVTLTPTEDADVEAVAERSVESLALSRYYDKVQAGLLTQGLLRQDGGGPDVPFTTRNLVDDFVRIALFDEYTSVNGRIVAQQTSSQLRKWVTPVRMKVEFGASIPEEQRLTDRANIVSYASRLSRISGLPIRQATENVNFHVFVVNEDERRALAPRIRQILPGIDEGALRAVVDMPRSTFCLVFALDPGNKGTYSQALAIIRGEHPNLLRLSCIHEEIAQGLGLSNDSPAARPSVFNDDEEFGLLTTHDEFLLRILYDPRMRPGMDEIAAREQAELIARDLMGGQS